MREALNREDPKTLQRWLHLLPEDFRQSRPGLLMIEVWLLHFASRLDELSRLLQRVVTLIEVDVGTLSADDLRILRGQILALRAQAAHFSNRAAHSIAYAREALTLLPQSWTFVRGLCMLYLGLSLQTSGQADAADHSMWSSYEAAPDKGDSYALRILFALCASKVQAGELEQARQMGALMLEQARHGKSVVIEGWAHYWLGLLHYQWNELEAAAQHFQAIAQRRYSLHSVSVRHGLLGLILVQLARGETAGAEQTLDLLSQYDIDLLGYETADTLSARARAQYLRGDVVSAWRWADAFTAPVLDQSLYGPEYAHIARIQLLLARGAAADLQTAQQIVDALYEVAARTYNTRFRIVLLALRALALDAQGQGDAAYSNLQNAVELARPGDFIRTFVDLGSPMQALLNRLARHGVPVEAVRPILSAFPAPEPEETRRLLPQPTSPLVESLTTRELEILALLRERWSNKEIAQKLGITPVTVKRHIANLFGKLGVTKRRDAVATAEALGIIPPH